LTPTQKSQIQALIEQKNAANAGVRAAHEQLLDALADAVSAGTVNSVALAPKVQTVVAAIQAAEPTDRSLLENLHSILTPVQRTFLASQMESQIQMESSRQGGDDEGHLGWISKKLGLTSTQQSQAEMNYRTYYEAIDPGARAEMRQERMQMLEAFKGDSFVMSQLMPPRGADDIQRWVNHVVVVAAATAPVLTPDQRAAEAALFRTWATKLEK
jgi:Spy/CpxP family protein refolding chaperone